MNLILNKQLTKKNFDKVFNYIFEKYNSTKTIQILESLKLLGAIFSTKAGLSLSLTDLRIINKDKKIKFLLNIIEDLKVSENKDNVYNVQKINDIWNNTNNLLKSYILTYLRINDPNNQLLIVLESGARGSKEQIHQLIGLRSLMMDQSGNVVPFPIKNSFVDGLSIFEYLLSSFGARKGIIDTALKTADSGYLTRRLIESSYEIKIVSFECLNKKTYSHIKRICFRFKNYKSIILKNSVLSCQFNSNLCQNCFGLDYSTRHIVSLGENIGILSAHSISEPSTQLTMRTFHTGGVFTKKQTENIMLDVSGFIEIYEKQGKVKIVDWKNQIKELPLNKIKINDSSLKKNQIIVKTIQEKKNILPIYIAVLSKTPNKISLIMHNGQVFHEILKYPNIFPNNEKRNIYNIFHRLLIQTSFPLKFKYILEYIFNLFLFIEFYMK